MPLTDMFNIATMGYKSTFFLCYGNANFYKIKCTYYLKNLYTYNCKPSFYHFRVQINSFSNYDIITIN